MYEDELEALQAIFMEELTVSEDKRKISLRVLPFDDDSMNNVGIRMELVVPPEYPDAVPTINLHSIKGVSGRSLTELEGNLKAEANSHIGEPMIFIFAEVLKTWLGENNNEEDTSLSSSTKSIKKGNEKSKYQEGTPVTVETYQAWWNGFKAEMAIAENTTNEKVTGKLFFAKLGENATGDVEGEGDDEEGDIEEGELSGEEEKAPVEVNWEVFAEEDLGDLDELSDDDDLEGEKAVDSEKK